MPAPFQAVTDSPDADREANRAGRLSDNQARRLWRSALGAMIGWDVLAVLLGAIVFFVADKPLEPTQWTLAGGLMAVALVVGVWGVVRTKQAVDAGTVHCVVGAVTISRSRYGSYLTVGGNRLSLAIPLGSGVTEADCRVCWVPGLNRVVAVEPVRPAD